MMEPGNRIVSDRPVRGEQAYIYGLKSRAKRHHCIGYGTFSVDLRRLEELRRHYARAIRPISYVPLYAKACALAIQRSPEANAVLFKKPFGLKIVRFNQVDVNLPITRKIRGRWTTFIGTIRNAPGKSIAEIQSELVEYQRCAPEESPAITRLLRFARMPLWLALWMHRRLVWDPEFYIRSVGTCGLTFVEGGDWYEHVFPIAPTSVVFGIGSARREPVVDGDQVVIRRQLKCCIMADNYVVSGLTGARLARDFKELLESGSFVAEELAGHVPATAST